jgi:hypothetical protein
MKEIVIKVIKTHLPILAIFFLISLIYFYPSIENKVLQQGDVLSWRAMASEALKYNEKHDQPTLWANNNFAGMPMYQTTAPLKFNLLQWLDGLFHGFSASIILRWFGAMLIAYVGFLFLGINMWIAAIGAFLITFNPGNLTLLEAGHLTKLRVIEYSILLMAGVILAFRGKYWLGALLFAISIGLQVYHNHIQMTYYLLLTLIPLGLLLTYERVMKKEYKSLVYGIGFLLVAGLLGILTSAGRIITTQEYAKASMRGGSVLTKSNVSGTEVNDNGLQWDYAMQWSNGWGDLISGIIPGFVGGGSGEKTTTNIPLKKAMQAKGISTKQVPRLPMYFGDLPFTSGPFYFSIVCFFFFVLGMFYLKTNLKWWLFSSVLITCLMSLGKNFELFNKFLFDYLPYYDKFRTPNSVLTITSILIGFLAVITLNELITAKIEIPRLKKSLYASVGLLGGLCLVLFLVGSNWDVNKGLSQEMKIVASFRETLQHSDIFRSLIYILLSAAITFLFVSKKVTNTIFVLLVALILLSDIIVINRRYIAYDDFILKRNSQESYAPRAVDLEILKDPTLYYKVMDYTIDTYNSAMASNFHKTIGGYHPAKLRRYQDLIDHAIEPEREQMFRDLNSRSGNLNDSILNSIFDKLHVFNALNTKYFIVGSPGKETYLVNNRANGNAWFIKSIKWVKTPDEEIAALSSTDLKQTAVVHDEFRSLIENNSFDGNGQITLIQYEPNRLEYTSNSANSQIAVFSDVWYEKGWEVKIDDKPVKHFRTNYTLRGLAIPAGNHKIVFQFVPKAYFQGEKISLISSLLIFAMLGIVCYRSYKKMSI